jgi:DNA-3-methyladenine glycosylase II
MPSWRTIRRMWFETPAEMRDWSDAVAHLRRADKNLRAVIDRVGPCTLVPRPDPFVALCQSIYSQQISTAIATILFGRFRELFPRKRVTPAGVLKVFDTTPEADLKKCGLSRQKHAYLRDLAEHFVAKKIPVRQLPKMDDEAVIQALIGVNGVGRWTAEMFLIFVLNRPDVLPVDDLGLRVGVQAIFGLPDRPKAAEIIRLTEPWRPYRSIATWYLWRRDVGKKE